MGGQVFQSCWLLLVLSLKGILAGNWSVHLPPSPVFAAIGSSVVLQCSYDFPQNSNESGGDEQLSTQGGGVGEVQQYKVSSEIWCLGDSRCITPRYVYHSRGIFPEPSYQNRVQYLGQPGTKTCSLKISDLRESDNGKYVFYLITNHPTQKMPQQSGVQLVVSATRSSNSKRNKAVLIGVTIAILVVILVVIAYFMMRKQKSPHHQSYTLTATSATDA